MAKKQGWTTVISVILALVLIGMWASEVSAEAKPITLKYHSPFPKCYLSAASELWMDQVEKRTKGKVKFDRIFGGTLGNLLAQPENIKEGVFDLGMTCAVYNPGLYSAATVTILPFTTSSYRAQALAGNEIFQQPAVEKQFTRLNSKFMFHTVWDPQEILSSVPLRTIDDLKKIKLRAHGGSAEALKEVGVTTYPVPWGEVPSAAERGVIDAAACGTPIAARDFGLYDIFPYWVRIRTFYFLPLTLTMNLKTWNKLPPDVKSVMADLNKEMVEKQIELYRAEEEKAWEFLKKHGMKQVEFSKKDLEIIKEKGAKVVWDRWVQKQKAKGIPAQELLDKYFNLLRKYD